MNPYVELISDPYGLVYLDRDGYGHRGQEYTGRWVSIGREASGWNQNIDGSFTSQKPLHKRGNPIDPSQPYMGAPSSTGQWLTWGLAAIGVYAIYRAVKG